MNTLIRRITCQGTGRKLTIPIHNQPLRIGDKDQIAAAFPEAIGSARVEVSACPVFSQGNIINFNVKPDFRILENLIVDDIR